jgi:hypothetical protein
MLLRRRISNITPTTDGGITVDVEEMDQFEKRLRRYRLANVTRAADGNFIVHPDADGELAVDIEAVPLESATPGRIEDVFGSIEGL